MVRARTIRLLRCLPPWRAGTAAVFLRCQRCFRGLIQRGSMALRRIRSAFPPASHDAGTCDARRTLARGAIETNTVRGGVLPASHYALGRTPGQAGTCDARRTLARGGRAGEDAAWHGHIVQNICSNVKGQGCIRRPRCRRSSDEGWGQIERGSASQLRPQKSVLRPQKGAPRPQKGALRPQFLSLVSSSST
jgi:hypothetical protein